MPVDLVYTDEQLLQLMRSDDQEAFTMIYRRYWEGLFVTAAKALRGREEAEDVIQDVFLSLWKRRKELVVNESLGAYLQTSIRYKAIHYIEKNITRRKYLDLIVNADREIKTHAADIQLQLKEVQEAIQETIAGMPPKMREVYCLSRNEYLTHHEIADKLDISRETVKKHIQHALQIIKTALESKDMTVVATLIFFHMI